MQKETRAFHSCIFSFFLVMFPGRPAFLHPGRWFFSFAVLVVATLLVEPNTLALVLTGIALLAIYLLRRQIKRTRYVLLLIVGIWFVCVGVQRFVVPFVFDRVFQPYQVKTYL